MCDGSSAQEACERLRGINLSRLEKLYQKTPIESEIPTLP
jgi:hypothetical protein